MKKGYVAPPNYSDDEHLGSVPGALKKLTVKVPSFRSTGSYERRDSDAGLSIATSTSFLSTEVSPRNFDQRKRYSLDFFPGTHTDLLLFSPRHLHCAKSTEDSACQDPVFNIRVISYDAEDIGYLPLDAYATRLTPDFYQRMYDMAMQHGIITSFRLQGQAYEESNRRYSLDLDDEIIASPKATCTSTQSNPSDTLCTGHLPRDKVFQINPFEKTDNNVQGAFPAKIKDTVTNVGLLSFLNKFVSPLIVDAKIFHNLVCFSEHVPTFEKVNGLCLESGDFHSKHYIQEAERINSIIDRILRKIYTFVKVHRGAVFFKAQNGVLCKIDLNTLTPDITLPSLPKDSLELSGLLEYIEQYGYLNQVHAPVFYQSMVSTRFIPVMTQAGANGYHIAPDTDPEHIGIRTDMPWCIYRSFNGKLDKPEKFLGYLQVLLAQLNSPYPTNYSAIPYYRDVFIPLAKQTCAFYKAHPEQLQSVGESSSYDLIMQRAFNHVLYQHGPEDLHPKSHPSEFGAILICYKGIFLVTADEAAYLAFLLHDPYILKFQRIGVHPYWLRDRGVNEDPELSQQWLDIIEIHALNAALKDGIADLQMFHAVLIDVMIKGRACEEVAVAKVEVCIEGVYPFANDRSAIQQRLDAIYAKYTAAKAYVSSLFVQQQTIRAKLAV